MLFQHKNQAGKLKIDIRLFRVMMLQKLGEFLVHSLNLPKLKNLILFPDLFYLILMKLTLVLSCITIPEYSVLLNKMSNFR